MTANTSIETIPAHQLIKGYRVHTYRGWGTITTEVGYGEGGVVSYGFTPDDAPADGPIFCTADPLEPTQVEL